MRFLHEFRIILVLSCFATSCHGMFHKRAREFAGMAPGPDRMVRNLKHQFLSNQASAASTQELFQDAAAIGIGQARRFAKTGAHGKRKNNLARDLIRACLKGTQWPPVHYVPIEVWDLETQAVITVKLPVLFPHEIVFALAQRSSEAQLQNLDHACQMTKNNVARACVELSTPGLVAVGLWGDGVPCNFDRSQSLEMLTMSIVGPPSADNMRIPLTGINKKYLIKGKTWDQVLEVLAWSFQVLAIGIMPTNDHRGRLFQGKSRRWAGKKLPQAVLAEMRGDWGWFKTCFRFPQHNEVAGICWRCNCTPRTLRQVGLDASWRGDTLNHWSLLQRMVALGVALSPIWGAPCLRSSCFLVDWLHAADQGILLHFLAGLFKFCLSKYPGASQQERCKALFVDIKLFYRASAAESRLDNLTLSMLGEGGNKPPKLRARAAESRGLVPFAVELATRFLDEGDELESTLKHCTLHLEQCYKNLSPAVFSAASLRENSRKFCLLYVALEGMFDNKTKWHVTPKLHLFQELCETMDSCPSLTWTYRDEDAGGTAMQISRRRGGANTVTNTASSLLHRFVGNNPLPFL